MIDVPFSTETAAKGAEAVAAFRAAMTWLPAFARTIRRVQIEGDAPISFECAFSPLLKESAIDFVLSVSGQTGSEPCASIFLTDTASCSALALPVHAHSPRPEASLESCPT